MADTAKTSAFRSFVIAAHDKYGILLLRAYKKKKGEHFQLPGGHVDSGDWPNSKFSESSTCSNIVKVEAGRNAAARELFEETGIDVRSEEGKLRLRYLERCGQKNRFYFSLELSDADNPDLEDSGGTKALSGHSFALRLSKEHTGFTFVKDASVAVEMTVLHSNGKSSAALQQYAALQKNSPYVSVNMCCLHCKI